MMDDIRTPDVQKSENGVDRAVIYAYQMPLSVIQRHGFLRGGTNVAMWANVALWECSDLMSHLLG